MPRGVRRTTEKLIADIDLKIAKKKDEIKELEMQKREILDSNQAAMAAKVLKLAAEKGVSIEALLSNLEK
ncbi:MAG: hypothetical protein FWH02_02490 [Oscillospiraceae bacterium]|nr:hypothetical protein [Oscillospiraceae bacterium]